MNMLWELSGTIEISTLSFLITRLQADAVLFPHHYGYGAGRRICPGIHLAERSMWRITAKLLWAFEFSEKPDAPLDVNAYNSANLVRPLEYSVNVQPRSPAHLAVIKRELSGAMEFLKQYD
jgi:cytochrome P450